MPVVYCKVIGAQQEVDIQLRKVFICLELFINIVLTIYAHENEIQLCSHLV